MGVDEKNRFSLRQLDSYNRMLCIVIGARTWGKTYQVKRRILKQYEQKEKKGIYLRRFDTELKEISKNLFDDTSNDFLPANLRIQCDNSNIWYQHKEEKIQKDGCVQIKWKGDRMGYLMHLAKAQSIKSGSFRDVSTFCFDEFLIEDNIHHYYKNEVDTVLSMISTINRDRSGSDKCKCYFLANAVTSYNPYFKYWNIKGLNEKQNWYLDFNPQVVVYYDRNEAFEEEMSRTEYAELIKGTRAEKYQMKNQFLLDMDNDFVSEKPMRSTYSFTLVHKNQWYGVYWSHMEGKYWISHSCDKNFRWTFASTGKDLRPNFVLLKENMFFKYLKSAYRNGYLYYEDLGIFKEIEDMLEILNMN